MNRARKKTILYVDDEECTLRTFTIILSSQGYDVVAMQCSCEALEAFSKEPWRYDLVITDHNMPKLTGCDLSERLLKIRADIPIILYTGHSIEMLPEKVKTSGIKAFLTKPINGKALSGIISKILEPVLCETL